MNQIQAAKSHSFLQTCVNENIIIEMEKKRKVRDSCASELNNSNEDAVRGNLKWPKLNSDKFLDSEKFVFFLRQSDSQRQSRFC